jgi:hypothetical protein
MTYSPLLSATSAILSICIRRCGFGRTIPSESSLLSFLVSAPAVGELYGRALDEVYASASLTGAEASSKYSM